MAPIEQIREAAGAQERAAAPRTSSFLMHPAFIIPGFTLIGFLFASQEWIDAQHMNYQIGGAAFVFKSWVLQYFLWGVIWWLLWRLFRPFILEASLTQIFAVVLPASLLIILLEEIIYVPFIHELPNIHGPMTFWQLLEHQYLGDIVESMAIFWGGFFFF